MLVTEVSLNRQIYPPARRHQNRKPTTVTANVVTSLLTTRQETAPGWAAWTKG